MKRLLEVVLENGLLPDALGIIGLGLLGLAAVKLARSHQSRGSRLMAVGAISLLSARLYFLLFPLINDDMLSAIGPVGISLTYGLPPLLLTFGLVGVVWGLWSHERWINQDPG